MQGARLLPAFGFGGTRIGQGSFDGLANSITQMFDFTRHRENGTLFLNHGTGQPEGDR